MSPNHLAILFRLNGKMSFYEIGGWHRALLANPDFDDSFTASGEGQDESLIYPLAWELFDEDIGGDKVVDTDDILKGDFELDSGIVDADNLVANALKAAILTTLVTRVMLRSSNFALGLPMFDHDDHGFRDVFFGFSFGDVLANGGAVSRLASGSFLTFFTK